MTGLGLAATIVACVWLVILTGTVLLLIQQLGLITVRLDRSIQQIDVDNDGLDVGASLPAAAMAAHPALSTATYLLVVSAACAPCRQIIEQVRAARVKDTSVMTALITGRANVADGVASLLPPGVGRVLDPRATAIMTSLDIHSVPFILQLDHGVVRRKAFLRGGDEFDRFLDSESRLIISSPVEDEEKVL